MICKNCGQPISDGANFCGHCGEAVSKNCFCSTCGAQLAPEDEFCRSCGKTVGDTFINAKNVNAEPLDIMKYVSMYMGEPMAGYSAATGTLLIYADRLEFKKKKGSALSSRSGLMGGIANALLKIDPIIIYPLNEIVELRIGKYLAAYNTLVVVLKDETISFCPVVPKSSHPQKILDILKPYIPLHRTTDKL